MYLSTLKIGYTFMNDFIRQEIKKNMNTSVLAINFPRELTSQRKINEIFGKFGEIVQSRVILAGAKIPNYLRVSTIRKET